MEILGREFDQKTLAVGSLAGLLVLVLVVYFLTASHGGYEAELFSLMPSKGLTGAAYAQVSEQGLKSAYSLLGPIAADFPRAITGAQISVGTYEDGSSVLAAFISGIEREELVDYYGDFSQATSVTERLDIAGREIYAVYEESDLSRRRPVCVWDRPGGIAVMAVMASPAGGGDFCSFPSTLSCRGQEFEDGLLKIKVKSGTGGNIIITEVACGATSLSSKNLRYTKITPATVGTEREVWLDAFSCFDAAGNLAVGDSFTGKLFVKYYDESEGSGGISVISGDVRVGVSSGGEGVGDKRCIDILETGYDSSGALSLLSTADELGKMVPGQEGLLGDARLSDEDGAVYAAAYGNDEGNYILAVGDSAKLSSAPMLGRDDLKCVGTMFEEASILNLEGKSACKREFNAGFIKASTYERRTDERYRLWVVAIPKQDPKRADRAASDMAFAAELKGSDLSWINETTARIKVLAVSGSNKTALTGAEVSIYALNDFSAPAYSGLLLSTKETDGNGTVLFEKVPMRGAAVTARKYGYKDYMTGDMLSETYLSEMNNFSAEIMLSSSEGTSPVLEDYLTDSYYTAVDSSTANARGTFPELSAYGLPLVNSEGEVNAVVVIGEKSPAEEVAAATRIAEALAGRAYACDVNVKAGGYAAREAYSGPIITTDSNIPAGRIIAVGDPETNIPLRTAFNGTEPGTTTVKEIGDTIVVYSKTDISGAAEQFISSLESPRQECGGGTYFAGTEIIDTKGLPAVNVVIGKDAPTEDALAGAMIAVKLASLSSSCVNALSNITGCVSSFPSAHGLLFTGKSIPDGYPVISVGGPRINNYTMENCIECSGLGENQGLIRPLGNDLFIAGNTMDDTIRATEEFLSGISNPVPSSQKALYSAIKVSSFTEKLTGHHEVGLSFYNDKESVQTGKASLGETYKMQDGVTAKIVSISARNVGSASVTFDIAGHNVEVGMGKFLCYSGAIEDSLSYCVMERADTHTGAFIDPSPALLKGKLEIFASYEDEEGPIEGAHCTYCITGPSTLCGNMSYAWPVYDGYKEEMILENTPVGDYSLQVNCSAENYKNGTTSMGFHVTKMELPDLKVDMVSVHSVINTKLGATVRISNIGTVGFNATPSKPLVTCIWDGVGRNLFSYVSYNATIAPGGTYQFTQDLLLPEILDRNKLIVMADCNNIFAEEEEDNNQLTKEFGRYG